MSNGFAVVLGLLASYLEGGVVVPVPEEVPSTDCPVVVSVDVNPGFPGSHVKHPQYDGIVDFASSYHSDQSVEVNGAFRIGRAVGRCFVPNVAAAIRV